MDYGLILLLEFITLNYFIKFRKNSNIITAPVGPLMTIRAAERSAARTIIRTRNAKNAVVDNAAYEARRTISHAENSALNVIGRAESSAHNVIGHAEDSGHRLMDHGQRVLGSTLDKTSAMLDQTREAGLELTRETERASAELIDQAGDRGDLLFSRGEQTSARITQ